MGACNLLHQLRQAKRNPLAERDMQEVVVPDSDWDAEVKGKQSWSKMVHVSTCLDPEWGAKACFLHKAATCSLRTQACTDGTAAAVVHRKPWPGGWRRMASMCCCWPSFSEGHPSMQLFLGASCCSRWLCEVGSYSCWSRALFHLGIALGQQVGEGGTDRCNALVCATCLGRW